MRRLNLNNTLQSYLRLDQSGLNPHLIYLRRFDFFRRRIPHAPN